MCITWNNILVNLVSQIKRKSLDRAVTLLLNGKFSWAECLPVIIGGSTRVNVTVVRASLSNNQGTTAVFHILYLNWGGFHHRLFSTQPHHLWVRISCQNRSNRACLFHFKSSKSLKSEPWGVPVRWQERRALDPEVTVWSFRDWVKRGGPCILCSRVWRACSASGLNGDSERKGQDVACNWQCVNFFTF